MSNGSAGWTRKRPPSKLCVLNWQWGLRQAASFAQIGLCHRRTWLTFFLSQGFRVLQSLHNELLHLDHDVTTAKKLYDTAMKELQQASKKKGEY